MPAEKSTKKQTKKKTNKNNTAPITAATTVLDFYQDCYTMRRTPITQHFIDILCQDLLNWAKNDEDALVLDHFFDIRSLSISNISRWRKKFPELDKAYQLAKSLIGTRREIGGLKKKYDSSMVVGSMSMYKQSWKEMAEWKSSLKNKEKEQSETKVVIIERFPDSKEVPPKEE